jgi:hypothetical protein
VCWPFKRLKEKNVMIGVIVLLIPFNVFKMKIVYNFIYCTMYLLIEYLSHPLFLCLG